jgi:hypothetical protein
MKRRCSRAHRKVGRRILLGGNGARLNPRPARDPAWLKAETRFDFMTAGSAFGN